MNRFILKRAALLFCFYILSISVNATIESKTSVSVHIPSGFDGEPMWVGVSTENEVDRSIHWSYADEQAFSVEFSDTNFAVSLVVLKRDIVPIIKSLTFDSITNGITIEFSEGESVIGTVVTAKDDSPISEGLITVQFDEILDIPLPEEDLVFAWELEEDGTFEIQGLPLGEHTVSVLAPGYMPAEQQVFVESTDRPQALEFQLTKAVHIHGYILDRVVRSRTEGTFDVVVTPAESQTVEVRAEFDDDSNFRLGPFAEDAVVELVARTDSDLRSLPIEVTVPTDDLVIPVYRWIHVLGTVQDRDTGEPISEFSFITGNIYDEVTDINDPSGQFKVEIREQNGNRIVSLRAPGYSFWSSEVIDFRRVFNDELDLGTIELVSVYTVHGRVLDQLTREPIEGAEIRRDDSVSLGTDARAVSILRWNAWQVATMTNADGEFQLDGIPAAGSGVSAWASGYVQETITVEDVTEPLEFELKHTGSISGQVVMLTGEPVPAMIHFDAGGRRTDDGSFLFMFRPGTYRFKAFADEGTSKVVQVSIESGESVEGLRLVIEVIGRVTVTVTGLLNKETAIVWVDGVAGAYESIRSDGEFEITGVPNGSHLVKSRTSLGRELDGTVIVGDNQAGRIELIFQGSSSLSGRLVSGSDGLADYRVQVQSENPLLPVVRTQTKRDGSYHIEGLIAGSYRIEVPSFDITQQIEVQGETYSDILLSANRLFGKLRGSGSVAGAEVHVKGGSEDREISLWTKVSADGSYRFNGIPSGTYKVSISHPDYTESWQLIELDDGHVEFDLQLHEETSEFED